MSEIVKVAHSKIKGDKQCFTCDSMKVPHYYYKGDKGTISLVYPTIFSFGEYEIYCIEGNLFEDIERYPTLAEAESRIEELLEGKIVPENTVDKLLYYLKKADESERFGTLYFCVDCMKKIASDERGEHDEHTVVFSNADHDGIWEWIRCIEWLKNKGLIKDESL